MDIDPGNPKRESVKNGESFFWQKNCWLVAPHIAIEILLPGDLIEKNEPLGSIIESPSPDIQIGFHLTKWRKKLKNISVRLPPSQRVRLHRSANAMLKTDSPFPVNLDFFDNEMDIS